ncbi:5498_t:CDS:2 [Cetraspora pellucida]|uniref:5498_t:CDS:1 n=1 Tax=Cetraspora pellucida TaxID=1433469 RepID=A0A9N9EJA7_9GLOM|nr:5498_t:CDS:2 [Cetraspora pellucida]
MWIGTTPPCLQDLTILEQLMISSGYLCINLIQITNKKHTHHKLKGHIITLSQNPSSLAKVLPLPMFRLCDYLKVVFWLFEHNKLFKDHFKLDKNILNSLPEGEIPESLALMTTVIDFNAQNIEHFTGYTHDSTCNFRSSGVLHVNDVPVSEEELTLNSLQKLVEKSNLQYKTNTITEIFQTKIICIPHSQTPLNEYEDPTLFSAAFPVLYLYSVGGHKGHSQQVSFKEYINHLMRHRDPKFHQHRSFPFITFNILQRHEVSSESYSLTKYSNFERSANLINTLKPNDIKLAIEQKRNKKPITNPAILELLKNINSAGSKLMASCQSYSKMRNEIHATITRDGIPLIFMTINPADLYSPIIIMYTGNEINFDKLLPDNFLKATERARLASLDPSAVAKYFDIIIQTIKDTIIGYSKKNGGVFGIVKNYYGVVEYQDRGTPHCHMIIWLNNALDLITLRQKLKNDSNFSQHLLQYISNIVRKDISYLTRNEIITNEMLKTEYMTPKTLLEKRMHPSFNLIPDPKLSNFEENFHLDLLAIAKHTLFHHCNKTCKKYNRGLKKHCHFDFSRELVNPPGIIFPEQGIIAVQCTNAFINNHNPYITTACRGNNDIKFILTQKLALAYVYYITDYITNSDNASINLINKSRKLITKCLNKITGQVKLTSPQVSAYLLGIPDHYTPNKFVSIYLPTFVNYFTNELKKHNQNIDINAENSDDDLDEAKELYSPSESFMISSFQGKLTVVNLRVDYQFQGLSLDGICLYDYASTIYKIPINLYELSILSDQHLRNKNTHVDRFFFHRSESNSILTKVHPQCKTHIQIQRRRRTERIVTLYSKTIPKKDDTKNEKYYKLSILTLFKPWKSVYDLIENYDFWADACQAFLNNPSLPAQLLFAKACRIECSVPGYDAKEELILLDDYDNLKTDNTNNENFDPEMIIRSELKDINSIDSMMNIL